jgi:hypothetical protein
MPAQYLVDDLAAKEDVGQGMADQLADLQLAL